MIRSVGPASESPIVVDASVVADALLSADSRGAWAEEIIATRPLVAPHLVMVEVAQVLRRSAAGGLLDSADADWAHRRLQELPVQLFGYEAFGDRAWELRESMTMYDAWYVALAEGLELPLATCDERLVRAHGARCEFLRPP